MQYINQELSGVAGFQRTLQLEHQNDRNQHLFIFALSSLAFNPAIHF
jgi:hypothetical protein